MTIKRIMMILGAGIATLAQTLPPPYTKMPDSFPSMKDIEDVHWVDDLAKISAWSPAEAEMLPADPIDGHPAFTFHVPVDHFAGEVKYPIGWPRAYCSKVSSINWKDYDFFQFKIFAKMNREALPKKALSLAFRSPDKGINFEHAFGKDNFRLNEWQTFALPISRLAALHSVNTIGIYVCESEYNHGDTLDFTIGGFRLIRSSAIKITSLACDGVNYGKMPVLNVTLTAEGSSTDMGKGVPFTLSNSTGKVLRHEILPVIRGVHSIAMDVSELRLTAGDYKLTAFPENPEKRLSVGFKIIDSPWEVKK
ncbi:MAG: hypothetical protein J6X55_09680 [Victivallales bacterium]|nr:hypothetical protein [Victivallales bacterium]